MGRDLNSNELTPQSDGTTSMTATNNTDLRVSPFCVPNESKSADRQWFFMRVSYGREVIVNDYLHTQNIQTFYPQQQQIVETNGKRQMRTVSLIPNSLFVLSTEQELKQYIGKAPIPFFHHFYVPDKDSNGQPIGTGRKPLVIPDNQMENFITWCTADGKDKLLVNTVFQFKNQDLVRVIHGPFTGFTGHVVRYKGQQRVGVNIDGVGFITTTYIPKGFLEKINP